MSEIQEIIGLNVFQIGDLTFVAYEFKILFLQCIIMRKKNNLKWQLRGTVLLTHHCPAMPFEKKVDFFMFSQESSRYYSPGSVLSQLKKISLFWKF